MRTRNTIGLHLNRNGVTVVMNSHLLSEVELVASRAALLDNGRLVAVKNLDAASRGEGRGTTTASALEEWFFALVKTGADARV